MHPKSKGKSKWVFHWNWMVVVGSITLHFRFDSQEDSVHRHSFIWNSFFFYIISITQAQILFMQMFYLTTCHVRSDFELNVVCRYLVRWIFWLWKHAWRWRLETIHTVNNNNEEKKIITEQQIGSFCLHMTPLRIKMTQFCKKEKKKQRKMQLSFFSLFKLSIRICAQNVRCNYYVKFYSKWKIFISIWNQSMFQVQTAEDEKKKRQHKHVFEGLMLHDTNGKYIY